MVEQHLLELFLIASEREEAAVEVYANLALSWDRRICWLFAVVSKHVFSGRLHSVLV